MQDSYAHMINQTLLQILGELKKINASLHVIASSQVHSKRRPS
jgi:hypothetical protein